MPSAVRFSFSSSCSFLSMATVFDAGAACFDISQPKETHTMTPLAVLMLLAVLALHSDRAHAQQRDGDGGSDGSGGAAITDRPSDEQLLQQAGARIARARAPDRPPAARRRASRRATRQPTPKSFSPSRCRQRSLDSRRRSSGPAACRAWPFSFRSFRLADVGAATSGDCRDRLWLIGEYDCICRRGVLPKGRSSCLH